jgi:hypothetical protein
MIQSIKLLFCGVIGALLLQFCARPCPKDIKIGTLDFSGSTEAWLPANQQVESMTFKNTAGTTLTFTNANTGWKNKRTQLPIETLCERGDYLDKTTQISYYDVEAVNLYYQAPNNTSPTHTLEVSARFSNAGPYGVRSDTAFYESVSVSGQFLGTTPRVGGISLLSNERGNSAKIPQFEYQGQRFRMIADTTVGGRNLKDVWTNAGTEATQTFFVFYTKLKGVEAFVYDSEVWLRE